MADQFSPTRVSAELGGKRGSPGRSLRGLMFLVCFALAGTAVVAPATGEVKLPALIGDNMVLQQGQKVSLWGTAEPGEKVAVTLAGRQASAVADGDGRWRVELEPLAAGGPHELTIAGTNTIMLKNVMVGEVWVCSGQSNMTFWTRGCLDGPKEVEEASYPNIRLFNVPRTVAAEPQENCKASWVQCSPKTVNSFSGLAYFFGRKLHQDLGVAVGLIHSSVGGTSIESWMKHQVLESDPEFAKVYPSHDSLVAAYQQKLKDHESQFARWQVEAEKAKAEGQAAPPQPKKPEFQGPGRLYNGMIAPLVRYTIQGVIWYQGESNTQNAVAYRRLFPALIQSWRCDWGRGDFPLLFVQLAGYGQPKDEPAPSSWAVLREAQLMALSVPRTAMAVAIDVGEPANIHPRNKQEVGRRLALAAEAMVYGKDVVSSGPIYESAKVEGDKVRIAFRHIGGGLTAKGGEPLKGFEIAGADRKFVRAEARIEGDNVIVRSDRAPEPAAVRYAWAGMPECDLYNKEGLPASPFRTDDWP